MRSLVTGLVMLVDLLKSHDTRVLAAACAVIGILAKEPENLAILTDYDIVQRLSSLVHTVTYTPKMQYWILCTAQSKSTAIITVGYNFSFAEQFGPPSPFISCHRFLLFIRTQLSHVWSTWRSTTHFQIYTFQFWAGQTERYVCSTRPIRGRG